MKSNYLIKAYDALLQLIETPNKADHKKIYDELFQTALKSYRIYTIKIERNDNIESVIINTPIHSFHPSVIKLELKSIFQIKDFEKHIPFIKQNITFTGAPVQFANDPMCENTFHVYEQCAIEEIPQNQRLFLYCNLNLTTENRNIIAAIKEKIFKLGSYLEAEHYIHKNQSAIEGQLNILFNCINPKTSQELYEFSDNYAKIDAYKLVYVNLEKILVFIEKEYKNYLNLNHNANKKIPIFRLGFFYK